MQKQDIVFEGERIIGEQIYIRPITKDDTDNIIKWRNSDFVREHFIYQALFTRESHEAWMKNMVETGRVDQLIICLKDETVEGVPVGSVYIRDIDRNHNKAEYGIFIGEESARGQGIGSMTAALMVEYCFKQLRLHRLFLRVFADNHQAIRSYEKAGFVADTYTPDVMTFNGESWGRYLMVAKK